MDIVLSKKELRPRQTLRQPERYTAQQAASILWNEIENGDLSDDPGVGSQDDGEIDSGMMVSYLFIFLKLWHNLAKLILHYILLAYIAIIYDSYIAYLILTHVRLHNIM